MTLVRTLSPNSETRSAYVYAILVEGVVRYIGKGRNGRMCTHLIEAKRSAARCGARTTQLSPRMHRRLVEAVRSGADIKEKIIVGGLTDREAPRIESRLSARFTNFAPTNCGTRSTKDTWIRDGYRKSGKIQKTYCTGCLILSCLLMQARAAAAAASLQISRSLCLRSESAMSTFRHEPRRVKRPRFRVAL